MVGDLIAVGFAKCGPVSPTAISRSRLV